MLDNSDLYLSEKDYGVACDLPVKADIPEVNLALLLSLSFMDSGIMQNS